MGNRGIQTPRTGFPLVGCVLLGSGAGETKVFGSGRRPSVSAPTTMTFRVPFLGGRKKTRGEGREGGLVG